MDTDKALKAISILADWGIFQLAMGGGEPFSRPDLIDLTSSAAQLGMAVLVTTGVTDLSEKILQKLSPAVSILQLNIDELRLLQEPEKERARLTREIQKVIDSGMKTGANLKLSNTTLTNSRMILDQLEACGFTSITLLRYKPPPDIDQWKQEHPALSALLEFEPILAGRVAGSPHLSIRVDCALAFVFRHMDPGEALKQGIRGCVAAQGIAGLDPLGNLLPCSQLAGYRFQAGNILQEEPGMLWREARILKTYRHIRNKAVFKQSHCGICPSSNHCGGCRVYAHDALGADPFCPEPLQPPLKNLGRTGRKIDLETHLPRRGTINIGEYMERYGVGQEKAVNELRNCPLVVKSDSTATGRKKADTYSYQYHDQVAEIQDSIGYTTAGFPYMTAEEISVWLEENDPTIKYQGYPLWLLQAGAIERGGKEGKP